jgi:hypothetical protein
MTRSTSGRLRVAFLNTFVFLAPVLVSVVLLLMLFNNSEQGRLSLAAIIGANTVFILVLSWGKRGAPLASPMKLASWYVTVVLACVLLIEALFPVCFPAEHAEVLNLSRGFLSPYVDRRSECDVVFDNDQPDASPASAAATHDPGAVTPAGYRKPAARFEYYGCDPNTGIRYLNAFHWNSRGYYDVERDVRKQPGVFRIVFVGDSFVESCQVPLARTFHNILEKMLNSSVRERLGKRFEVIPFGNSGNGQLKNRDTLAKEALAFDPDLVVMTLYINDFCDDDPRLSREMAQAAGLPTPWFRRLASHGYLALAFALRRLEHIQVDVSPELLQWCDSPIPRVETAWNRTLEAVKESHELCRARSIPFILLYIGSELEVKHALDPEGTRASLTAAVSPELCRSWDMAKSVRRVRAYCNQHDILFASLLDPLITAQRDTGKHVFGDHYSMFGHEVVAESLLSLVDSLLRQKEGPRAFDHVSPRDDFPSAPASASTGQ